MDLQKLKNEDIRLLSKDRLLEVERDLRKNLSMLRMKPQEEAKMLKMRPMLRKNLARVLTYKTQLKDK